MSDNVATAVKNNSVDVWNVLKSYITVEFIIYTFLTLAVSIFFKLSIFLSFAVCYLLNIIIDKFLGVNIVDKLRTYFSWMVVALNAIQIKVEPSADWGIEITSDKDIDIIDEVVPVAPIVVKKEVFNVSNNEFNYDTARAVCRAYDSRIATLDEVENSYKAGGEWCNYGWTDGQMALFPTQKETFNKLQKIKGSENNCGRPGINGGFMANDQLKFGANCYGVKPKMTPKEEKLAEVHRSVTTSGRDVVLDAKVEAIKNTIGAGKIIINPFNETRWSRI